MTAMDVDVDLRVTTVLNVAWRYYDQQRGPCYLVDGDEVGRGSAGFDTVLALIRARPDARVTIALGGAVALGGQALPQSTPFADRFAELREALGQRALNWNTGT